VSEDERDTFRPKPEPVRMPVSKIALGARRPPNADVPVPEEEFQARVKATPAFQPLPQPLPPMVPPTAAPPAPAPAQRVAVVAAAEVQPLPSLWPAVGRWLAPRALLVLAGFSGGAAAPHLTGGVTSQATIQALSDKIDEQQKQLDAQDVEIAAQKKMMRQQTAFWVELWGTRGNIEIGYPDNVPTRDFNIGELQIDAPKDPKKPAVLKFPAVPIR
jgi:hypothetical protein